MALVRRRLALRLDVPVLLPPTKRARLCSPVPAATATAASVSAAFQPSEYETLQVLGRGSGGTVYKVKHRNTSQVYALKVVHVPDDDDPALRTRVAREVDILRRVDSAFVVKSHAFDEKPSGGETRILMEYMDAGSLDSLLKNTGKISEPLLAHLARQIVCGLEYLHANKIVHRDIKPGNLLINEKMELKIADFGISRILTRSLEHCDSYVGTSAYMSPERMDPDSHGGTYDGCAGDIWSLGLTLIELYLGHYPFSSAKEERPDWASLMCLVCIDEPPALPVEASAELRDFVACCLQKKAEKRSTAAQLMQHPFLHTSHKYSWDS